MEEDLAHVVREGQPGGEQEASQPEALSLWGMPWPTGVN